MEKGRGLVGGYIVRGKEKGGRVKVEKKAVKTVLLQGK